jgi:hypothetical protein
MSAQRVKKRLNAWNNPLLHLTCIVTVKQHLLGKNANSNIRCRGNQVISHQGSFTNCSIKSNLNDVIPTRTFSKYCFMLKSLIVYLMVCTFFCSSSLPAFFVLFIFFVFPFLSSFLLLSLSHKPFVLCVMCPINTTCCQVGHTDILK